MKTEIIKKLTLLLKISHIGIYKSIKQFKKIISSWFELYE